MQLLLRRRKVKRHKQQKESKQSNRRLPNSNLLMPQPNLSNSNRPRHRRDKVHLLSNNRPLLNSSNNKKQKRRPPGIKLSVNLSARRPPLSMNL